MKTSPSVASRSSPGSSVGIGFASAAVYALGALAAASAAADGSTDGLEKSLAGLGGPGLAATVIRRLQEADPDALLGAAEVTVQQRRDDPDRPPVRISVLEDRDGSLFGTAVDPDGNHVQIIQLSDEHRAAMAREG